MICRISVKSHNKSKTKNKEDSFYLKIFKRTDNTVKKQPIESFCMGKEMINRVKRHPTKCEKLFASHLCDKGLIAQIYQQLKNSTRTKPIQLGRVLRTSIDSSQKKKYKWPKKIYEKMLNLSSHQKMQVKTIMRYDLTPLRMAKFQNRELQMLERIWTKGTLI